ncbi:sigma 54 modulation/S30EA ribosomal C-terminal domain-containing protein [Kitasatospora sp. NPDC050463]|uniref:sigma 54 modulation/S30EA ribosomal C-terminal domain-containing protein n=1 Tax=Kitasatospora sp. NPDC050463 TaxID=3155786 RepID=UPI0033F1F99B
MGELVAIQVDEGLSRGVAIDTRARIAAVVSGADALVEAVRVRIRPVGAVTVLAQVNAEVDGRRIRVQEAATDRAAALDRLAEGLRARIAAVTTGWTPLPWPRRAGGRGLLSAVPAQGGASRAGRAPASAGASPFGAHPCTGLPRAGVLRTALPSSAGPRHIVRRKEAHLVWCSPDAAARTMDAMDFDIHLFTDPATETDAVVYRTGPTGYRLARTAAAGPPTRPVVPFTLSPVGAPELTEVRAVDRLCAADLPFLFFTQPGTRRGRVLYRRFDGLLGLIAAAP